MALDQGVKALIQRHIAVWASVPVIPGVLWLTHVRNTGIAFSLLSSSPLVVTALAAATALLLYLANRSRWQRDLLERVSLAMILGGAVGNLVDRARFGYVIDYVDLHLWPVFNAADASIVAGGLLLALALSRAPQGKPAAASKGQGLPGDGRR